MLLGNYSLIFHYLSDRQPQNQKAKSHSDVTASLGVALVETNDNDNVHVMGTQKHGNIHQILGVRWPMFRQRQWFNVNHGSW